MKQLKKSIAKALIIVLIMSSTLPCMATGNDVEQTYTSKIVEQLKEDLGEEKATEILNSGSESLIGGNESSTTMDSNNSNDETIVEGSDNEKSLEESTGNDTVEEPEEDITETSTEPTKDNTNLTCTEKIVETSKTDVYEIIATSSDLEDNLLLEVEESEGNNSNLFGDGEIWMWWYLTDSGQTIHYTSTEPVSGGNSVSGTTISYTGLTKSNITRAIFDDNIIAQTSSSLFSGFGNLNAIDNFSNFNTSSVTDMSYMFSDCTSLTSLNISSFDTSNVTDMCYMFYRCFSLTSLDLSSFELVM